MAIEPEADIDPQAHTAQIKGATRRPGVDVRQSVPMRKLHPPSPFATAQFPAPDRLLAAGQAAQSGRSSGPARRCIRDGRCADGCCLLAGLARRANGQRRRGPPLRSNLGHRQAAKRWLLRV